MFPQIAAALDCHPKTVRLWLHRFNTDGLDGLADQPIPGRPRRITETERPQIIALARTTPPGRPTRDPGGELNAVDETGPAQWTLNTLTDAAHARGIKMWIPTTVGTVQPLPLRKSPRTRPLPSNTRGRATPQPPRLLGREARRAAAHGRRHPTSRSGTAELWQSEAKSEAVDWASESSRHRREP